MQLLQLLQRLEIVQMYSFQCFGSGSGWIRIIWRDQALIVPLLSGRTILKKYFVCLTPLYPQRLLNEYHRRHYLQNNGKNEIFFSHFANL